MRATIALEDEPHQHGALACKVTFHGGRFNPHSKAHHFGRKLLDHLHALLKDGGCVLEMQDEAEIDDEGNMVRPEGKDSLIIQPGFAGESVTEEGESIMGDFRIVIDAVGGHGDDRTAKEGEPITIKPIEGEYASPDQLAKQFVDVLKVKGLYNLRATLTHWPGQPSEVVDDLVNMTRIKGQF